MTEKKLIVFIYLPGEIKAVPAGIFTHNSELSVGSFAYGHRYLERSNCLPVDPVALPLGVPTREVTTNGGLYGSFRDAAPDYWGRLVIASEAKTRPEALSEFDYLLAANATRIGNLDFRLSLSDPEPKLNPPSFNQLADIILAAEHIESGEDIPLHLIQLLRQGSSMGGARPKCTVEWEEALWIAKFPAKGDSINMPRLEYATMALAMSCGVYGPQMALVKVGKKDVFLSRRFDREKSIDGWYRTGFQSALSLMQWDERDRVQWAYPAIANRLRQFMSIEQIQSFYRRMIFNIMVRNTDDHPRNHGILFSGNEVTLSPAYDILPSLAQVGVGSKFNLAMSIGNHGREANLENALSQAEQFGFTTDKAKKEIEMMYQIVRGWKSHFEYSGFSENEITQLEASFINDPHF